MLKSIVVYERLSTLFLFSADFNMFEFAEPVRLNSRWQLCLHCLDTGSQIKVQMCCRSRIVVVC